jgi:TrmH family RNA methyltransferase
MVSKNQIKLLTGLHRKKNRDASQLFIAEGAKVIRELLDAGFDAAFLYQTEPVFKAGLAESISPAELKKISALATPNNCLAVFKMPIGKPVQTHGLTVALDDIRDPGNLGTIIRLCDWFGIRQIVCSNETADVYNPKVVQATMGSLARVAVHYADLTVFLKNRGLPVYGAFMDGANIYREKLPDAAVVVLGNEANGISAEVEKRCEKRIAIPPFGDLQRTESLNVATAAAIVLSEFRRG